MILYQCDSCGRWSDNKTGCSDNCALLEKYEVSGFLLTKEDCKNLIKYIYDNGYISHEFHPQIHAICTRLELFVKENELDK